MPRGPTKRAGSKLVARSATCPGLTGSAKVPLGSVQGPPKVPLRTYAIRNSYIYPLTRSAHCVDPPTRALRAVL